MSFMNRYFLSRDLASSTLFKSHIKFVCIARWWSGVLTQRPAENCCVQKPP